LRAGFLRNVCVQKTKTLIDKRRFENYSTVFQLSRDSQCSLKG